jgi:hypothetical protein
MKAFLVVVPDGRNHRLVFPSDVEAEANAEAMRKSGTTVIPLYWSQSLQRYVTVPNDDPDA